MHIQYIMNGISRKTGLLITCMIFIISCTNPHVTYTEVYYVSNETKDTVYLVTEHSVVWDTCALENPQRAYFSSDRLPIAGGKTVRLHPITREYRDHLTNDQINVCPLIGMHSQLIAGQDTIIWNVTYPYMFETDSVWSIYNKVDWETMKDNDLPYTYYHTFRITIENIERSVQ